MSQIKIPLIVGIVVFFVSGLLAFLGGSSYLGVIFKAVVSAVVAGAFVFVAKFLLQKYVPDVFENSEEMEEASSPIVGTNIDVRIGGEEASSPSVSTSAPQNMSVADDEGVSMEGLGDDSLAQEDPFKDVEMEAPDFKPMSFKHDKGNEVSVGEAETTLQKDSMLSQGEKKTQNENVMNSKEVSDAPSVQHGDASSDSNSLNQTDLAHENKEELKGVATGVDDEKLSEEEMTQAIEKDVDRLEELPDLHEFVDASATLKQSKAEELMSAGTQSFFETNLSENTGADAKLMANAIRTVLKRE